ncbi:glycosyltransferase family 2 protein [Sedimentibacter sp. B4]|uniref:glycosyltransferase family 2 protein n=1 Tax=Sedimentibacter sp. B4 TaxID=304766 RepID=UPI0002FCBF08|nr:glycosyltransferase family 2 protein [Sedimentibacter sp. B4]
MKKISLLIPVYNEEETLYSLFNEVSIVIKNLLTYDFEILFVDDGSADKSLSIIKELHRKDSRVNYISFSRNFGKETAMIAGFDYVSGDAVIVMDADLQDPPNLIPDMIKYWEEGYDDVYAKRRTREGETWLKRYTSHAFYKILQKLTQIPIQEDTGDFRLLDRSAIESLKMMREKQRYTKGMFSWIGFSKKEILFDRRPRQAGSTKWNYMKLFNLALEGVTSFTTFPLRIASIIGIIVSIFSIIYMLIILIKSLIWKDPVQGYPSMMVTILFLGGVQLVSLGIIGEYVGRIFNETKHRPLYIITEYNNKKIYDGGKM